MLCFFTYQWLATFTGYRGGERSPRLEKVRERPSSPSLQPCSGVWAVGCVAILIDLIQWDANEWPGILELTPRGTAAKDTRGKSPTIAGARVGNRDPYTSFVTTRSRARQREKRLSANPNTRTCLQAFLDPGPFRARSLTFPGFGLLLRFKSKARFSQNFSCLNSFLFSWKTKFAPLVAQRSRAYRHLRELALEVHWSTLWKHQLHEPQRWLHYKNPKENRLKCMR